MKAIIELENMAFHALHGCYGLEKVVGNRYLVDLRLEAEAGDAAANDDLSKSINYLTAYEVVREQMAQPSNILENVAYRILDALYAAFPTLEHATVKVSKLAPPLGGKVEKVSVTLSR
jgi:dihydroneopterin aldolase